MFVVNHQIQLSSNQNAGINFHNKHTHDTVKCLTANMQVSSNQDAGINLCTVHHVGGTTSQKSVPPDTDKKYPFCTCSMRTPKNEELWTAPTSHGHRSPLCIMVHNAGQWRTMQVCSAKHSPVPLSSHKTTHTQNDGTIFTTSTTDAGGKKCITGRVQGIRSKD